MLVERNQWKEKQKTSELRIIVNTVRYCFTLKIIPVHHSTLPIPPNHTHSQYIPSQHPTCPTKPHALPLYTFTVPYLSHQTKHTPTIYFHSALPVPPNHTHSHYIPSQHPTSPTYPNTLPLYTFTVPYLSHQTTHTPTIYLHSTLPVPPNHKHSHYIHSQCPTCPTKPHALPLYTFTVPYLSHQTTRTPTIYLHSTLPVPPNHTHSHYIPSQCPTCPTYSHSLSVYNFKVPKLSDLSTNTAIIYIHTALPVSSNHTHSQYMNSQCPTCPTKPNTLPFFTFTVSYLSHQTTKHPKLTFRVS